jgi:SAM-dependent methyltransferase
VTATTPDGSSPQPAATQTPGAAQLEMVHRLPKAQAVERIPHLTSLATGKRVIHVGFVDAGYQEMNTQAGTWLHAHLAGTASSLVGIDLDEPGVALAKENGYEAYVADCRDPEVVAALGLEPADLVIAGEVIEHLDDPGAFLQGLHPLVKPTGRLVITTPNASGLLNSAAALVGAEINHPDHVVLFSWRTLTNLMSRHGWLHTETATYVPEVKEAPAESLGMRLQSWGGKLALWLERTGSRLGAPFVADGLIVSARPAPERTSEG